MTRKAKIQFLKRFITGKATLDEIVIPKVLIKINNQGSTFYNGNTKKLLTSDEKMRIDEYVRKSKDVRIKVTCS